MIYPKYSREENKNCKYTIEEINEIKSLYNNDNLGYRKISKIMNIPQSTIRYHCLSEDKKNSFNKERYKQGKDIKKIIDYNKYNEDRKIRKGEIFRLYELELKKEYIKDPLVKQRKNEYMKEYMKKTGKGKIYWKEKYSNNEEYKEQRKKYYKEYSSKIENKQKKKEYMDEYTQREEYKEKRRLYMKNYRLKKKES